jgi:hypothetical protein
LIVSIAVSSSTLASSHSPSYYGTHPWTDRQVHLQGAARPERHPNYSPPAPSRPPHRRPSHPGERTLPTAAATASQRCKSHFQLLARVRVCTHPQTQSKPHTCVHQDSTALEGALWLGRPHRVRTLKRARVARLGPSQTRPALSALESRRCGLPQVQRWSRRSGRPTSCSSGTARQPPSASVKHETRSKPSERCVFVLTWRALAAHIAPLQATDAPASRRTLQDRPDRVSVWAHLAQSS